MRECSKALCWLKRHEQWNVINNLLPCTECADLLRPLCLHMSETQCSSTSIGCVLQWKYTGVLYAALHLSSPLPDQYLCWWWAFWAVCWWFPRGLQSAPESAGWHGYAELHLSPCWWAEEGKRKWKKGKSVSGKQQIQSQFLANIHASLERNVPTGRWVQSRRTLWRCPCVQPPPHHPRQQT